MKVLTLLLLTLSAGTAGSETSWVPDPTTIDKLEATIRSNGIPIKSPEKATELSAYNRYYAGYMSEDQKMVEGEFLVPFGDKSKPTSFRIVGTRAQLPIVYDGGCSVVHIVYSVSADRITSARCNGYA